MCYKMNLFYRDFISYCLLINDSQFRHFLFELVFMDSGLLDYVLNSIFDFFIRTYIIYTVVVLSEFNIIEQINFKIVQILGINFSSITFLFNLQKIFLILFLSSTILTIVICLN